MKRSKWFLVIFVLYIAGYLSHSLYLGKTVYGDGRFYYSWVRSVLIDFKLPPVNKYSIGPALVWSPAVLLTHTLVRGTGVEFPYQFFVGLSGVLLAIAGLVLLFRLLTRLYSPSVSMLSTVVIAFATNLFFYGSLDTVNSHAVSFFAAVFFLNVLLTTKNQWFLVGLSLGFVGLMRTQDLVYALTLIPYRKKANKRVFYLGFLLGFLPQLVAWQALYGKFWTSPYLSNGEGFTLLAPHILHVLFSYRSGLFFWTPILALGSVGLWFAKVNIWMKFVVLAQMYFVSTWSMWWQGASYSGRMFVSVLPIFALGIAHVFTWLWKRRWRQLQYAVVFIAPLTALNMLLIIYFLLIT